MAHIHKIFLAVGSAILLGGCLGRHFEERAMPLRGVTVVAPDAYWQKPAQQPPFCGSMDAVLRKMLQINYNWGMAAATDLTNALTKVTGASVALVRESAAHDLQGSVLHLGGTQVAKDAGLAAADMKKAEWRIACDGTRAFIYSQTGMGVAYGVTDFLARYAGYRFLTIDGEDPFEVRPDVAVPVCDFRRRHAIYARHFSSFDRNHPKTSLAYLPDYLRRLGLQLSPEIEPQIRPSVACGGYCHTWLRYCPPEKYAKEHPEYYSLFDDGTRHTSAPTMLCLSNPDVLEIVTSRMLACIAEDRAKYGNEAPTLYDFSQPDCCGFICRCVDCSARAERYGGDMGLQLTFVNALARRVREKHPDVTIRIFAYVSTEKIPVGIRPEPNVMIWLCDLYSRSDHQLPLTHPFNRERHDLIRDWKAIAPSFELWDYMLTEDDFPQISVDALAADARYFNSLGIDRIYHESQMGGQAFWELEYYVMSKMYMDPTIDLERTIDEYCAVYGHGAAEMRRAIDYLRKVIAENPPKSADSWHRRGLPWRTVEVMEGFRHHVRRAYDKEARPKMRARIALALQIADQELYRLGGGRTPEGQERLREEFLACASAVRDGGFYHPSERQEAYQKTVRKFQQANLRFSRLPKALENVPSSDLKCFDTSNTGIWSKEQKRVADPDSECGKALRVVPDAGDESIGWVLARDADTKRADRLPLALERSETYRWYRLGVSRIGRSSDVYVPVHVGFRLDGQYVECDGLAEDPNWYEYWISVKWNGDAHAADPAKGLFIDRLLLRRVPAPSSVEADVIVYGSTPAALTAAISAKKGGASVVIVSPETRIGGLTTGGLGYTDIGDKRAFGGLALRFYRDVAAHYGGKDDSMWTFEPSAALAILERWEKENGLEIVRGEYLDRSPSGVTVSDGRIVSFRTLSGRTFRGKVFVDTTYEGDLMAAAGVSYAVGRESNAEYGETLDGVQSAQAKYHQFREGVDPYVVKGKPSSGLLPGIEVGKVEPDGTGDRRVQAYCFRMCLTDDPANRIPFRKPEGYDERMYELLFRNFECGADAEPLPWINSCMPNRKTDTNNRGAFSTDFIGQNGKWPEGTYAEREQILLAHLSYQQGLMWTLANHPRVPEKVRQEVSRWGTCRDEFLDGFGDGWQRQLYVREARRMRGEYVMTEANCRRMIEAARPIAMAAYTMDSHHVRRVVDAQGFVKNEGDVEVRGGKGPYGIDYGAIVPKRGECRNLFVPVCLSASHIAFGSIRMEPVFFALGQAAGTAAAQAVAAGCDVQDLPYAPLAAQLVRDGQVIRLSEAR